MCDVTSPFAGQEGRTGHKRRGGSTAVASALVDVHSSPSARPGPDPTVNEAGPVQLHQKLFQDKDPTGGGR